MITRAEWQRARELAWEIVKQAGVVVREDGFNNIEVADVGLGELAEMDLRILTPAGTASMGVKLLILTPHQIFLQRRHSLLGDYPGKEEIFRGQWTEAYLYVSGGGHSNPRGHPPAHCRRFIRSGTRSSNQVRNSIHYPRLNVKIATSHGGVTPGPDGVTHQGQEDLSIMRAIAHSTVIAPADSPTTKLAVWAAAEWEGPIYLSFTRDPVPIILDLDHPFEIGKAVTVRDGTDATIIAICSTAAWAAPSPRCWWRTFHTDEARWRPRHLRRVWPVSCIA